MTKVAIFAHYDKKNKIEDYVVYYLEELKKIANNIIFVSDSDIDSRELQKISHITSHNIVGKHGEYDFGSYKRGFLYIYENNLLNNYDELIFANDSCFGPFFSFEKLWDKMSKKECDFWGTNENKLEFNPHIQSFFMVFKKQIFTSEVFINFIENIKKETSKQAIILNYEVGLNKLLIQNGYKYSTYDKNRISRKISSYIRDDKDIILIKKAAFNAENPKLSKKLCQKLYEKHKFVYPISLIENYTENNVKLTFKNFINTQITLLKSNVKTKEKENKLCANPKISILTASYNYENYIKETIESVLAQTYQNWEMVIVDDGSKDNSVEVIKKYCAQDSRIKLYQHENAQNKGLSETIQLGIKKATGDWIAFLESDDTFNHDYLEEKVKIAQKYPNVDFIYNDLNLFGDEHICQSFEKCHIQKQKKILKKCSNPDSLIKLFKKNSAINPVPTFSCVMTKPYLLANLNFNSPNKPSLDWFLWLQIAQNTTFYFIDKKLTNWRMHYSSYINSKINQKDVIVFTYKRERCVHGYGLGTILAAKFHLKCIRKSILQVHVKDKKIIFLAKTYKY